MGKKIRGRELLEACYVRKFRFESPRALRMYLDNLDRDEIPYVILELYHNDDEVLITLETQYNNVPLLRFT